jgi:hypothetical protein
MVCITGRLIPLTYGIVKKVLNCFLTPCNPIVYGIATIPAAPVGDSSTASPSFPSTLRSTAATEDGHSAFERFPVLFHRPFWLYEFRLSVVAARSARLPVWASSFCLLPAVRGGHAQDGLAVMA